MKILLIYPPGWIRYNLLPPLGIAILATTLRKEGHVVKQCNIEIDIVSSTHRKKTKIGLEWVIKRDVIKQYLRGHSAPELVSFLNFLSNYQDWNSYDAVCFSTIGELQVFSAAVIAKYIKNLYPEIKTILGGVFPVSMPEKTSKLLESIGSQSIDLTYKFDDAGERLVDILKRDSSYKTLNHASQEFADANTLSSTDLSYHRPTFDFSVGDQLDLVKSIYGLSSSSPMLQYLVSQGCSSKCAFCTRCQKPVVLRRPSDVADDLLYLSAKYHTKLFKLECNLINPSKQWLQDLCKAFVAKRLEIKWNAYAKTGSIDKAVAEKLKQAGCMVLRFGVESGSDHVLRILGKGYQVKNVEKILRTTKKAGIWNGVLFMLGVPGETEKDVEQTVEFIKRNSKYIDSALVNIFTLLQGTRFYQNPELYQIRIFRDILTGELCFHDLQSDRSWEDHKKFSISAHDRVVQALIDEGIGITGTCVDLLLWAVFHFQDHSKVREFLFSTHPQFFKPYPHHVQRWLLYHAEEKFPFPNYHSPILTNRLGYSGVQKKYTLDNMDVLLSDGTRETDSNYALLC